MAHSGREVALRDVARAAGVSISSASRALSGRGDLRRETRQRVLDAARELGYAPSTSAGGRPASSEPRTVELVLGSFDDDWTAAVTDGARTAAFELGFDLVLTLERDDPTDDWPSRVAARRPAGIVLGIIRPTHRQILELHDLRIPVILLDPRSDPDDRLMTVGTRDLQGGRDAGEHLVASGADRFVVVTGTPPYRFGRAREEGFASALRQAGVEDSLVRVPSQWTDATVTPELLGALAGAGEVGVFACNDEMALTVYRAARRLGKRIPDDVRVVGFNDEPRAASAEPALSSVRQPLREMAGRAVRLAVEQRGEAPDAPHDRVELPSTLVTRESSRRPTARAR
ncbi:LacI family DNA-binding transcriptional regulator [Rathayibacter sp. VKM Ac-2760]|uniref:LacI family DNA-binding transcriptional regulator n=1 Tax=Rathayibacter sp. VKM Ac-2760 TaxID=2609253 RepID=UPI001317D682|nr:LacI family DNA-binding transcriptional regulator [Rathayibacter sp. VKM Ac-2760]QHC61096.1 substrate-binding domain-containing protein [Rathayibacter sp. VKM Ac-2760]